METISLKTLKDVEALSFALNKVSGKKEFMVHLHGKQFEQMEMEIDALLESGKVIFGSYKAENPNQPGYFSIHYGPCHLFFFRVPESMPECVSEVLFWLEDGKEEEGK